MSVALEEKKRSGNAYAALYISKKLSETERLKLEIAKIYRLKMKK